MGRRDENLAKITRPRNRNFFKRSGLFKKLDNALQSPGVWITGPPGSGKTSLASSYFEDRERPIIWYRVDPNDADVATLFWYLRLAVRAYSVTAEKELPLYSSVNRLGVQAFAARFFERVFALLPEGFCVVLDDYHLVEESQSFETAILQAVSQLPASGNMVITSRDALPAAFCRLQGNELLAVIDWPDLRLALDELRGVAALRKPGLDEHDLQTIHAQSDGWLTGVIFHLQNLGIRAREFVPRDCHCHETLFGYFASEVFASQKKDLQLLAMQLALLPLMTQEMACELTGDERAGQLLVKLHSNNYFLYLHELQRPTYAFHRLFRTFLLERLQHEYASDELVRMQCRAARLLAENGYSDAAVELYCFCHQWAAAAELLQSVANEKIAQGRTSSLAEQLQSFPPDVLVKYPWLSYSLGVCLMFSDPAAALEKFHQAYEQFRLNADYNGKLAAWAGIVNATLAAWSDVTAIERGIEVGEQLFPAGTELPEGSVGTHAVAAMCSSLSLCQPHNPRLPEFTRATHERINSSPDMTYALMAGNLLLMFYAWLGDLHNVRQLYEDIRRKVGHAELTPAHRVMWWAAKSWMHIVFGETQAALDTAQQALQLAEQEGVHLFDYKLHGICAHANLLAGRPEDARASLDLYQQQIGELANLNRYHVNYLYAWERWAVGCMDQSLEFMLRAQDCLVKAGSPPIVAAKMHIASALLQAGSGDSNKAQEHLLQARGLAVKSKSAWLQYHLKLLDAAASLGQQRPRECAARLAEAFSLARRQEMTVTDWWDAAMMSRLCEFALNRDIEVDYVRHIICVSGLQPSRPLKQSLNWPWPASVSLLAEFEISIAGKAVPASVHSQKKAVELLQALVLLGEKRVATARLTDALWPDAEGDDGRNALKTTLHRLRKILGANQFIDLQHGDVELNRELVWTDVDAFKALAQVPMSDSSRLHSIKRALQLYRGPLLPDNDAEWVIGPRQKLQLLAHNLVMELGVRYEAKSRWDNAIRCYRKGLQIDPLDEQVCRHLMECYQRSGHEQDAIAVYEACRSELEIKAARVPSLKTRSLANRLQHH